MIATLCAHYSHEPKVEICALTCQRCQRTRKETIPHSTPNNRIVQIFRKFGWNALRDGSKATCPDCEPLCKRLNPNGDNRNNIEIGNKITKKQASEIKKLIRKGEIPALIAKRYSISVSMISKIKHGILWTHAK